MHYTWEQYMKLPYRVRINDGDTCECIYCHSPVVADYDCETNRYYLLRHHFRECWHSGRSGPIGIKRYAVISSSHDGGMEALHYDNALRAQHQAEDYAAWNNKQHQYCVIDTQNGNALVFSARGRVNVR